MDYAQNISRGGLFLATNESFTLGQRIELQLCAPQSPDPIGVPGVVRWVGSRGVPPVQGIGIQFELERTGIRDQIESMVNSINEPVELDGLLVYIVDPNEFASKMYAEGIERSSKEEQSHLRDLRVVRFSNVEDALAAFRTQPSKLVITELEGKGFDGAALITTLRAEGDVGLPIFAISRPFSGDRQRALMLGATAFLPKPLQLKTLFNTLSLSLCQVGD